MGRTGCDIRIGTSGWHYDHWRGRFYPEKLPKNRWLEHYAQHFDTVEINNTFYHLPKEHTVVNWHDTAPAHFLYAVKASRYITHVKKLNDPSESLDRFFGLADLLNRRTVGFCVHDMAETASPRVVTGDKVYVRFHGTTGRYGGNYTDAMLAEWADWLIAQAKSVKAIYVYFNNDLEGYAVCNAGTPQDLLTD
ncbi:DUF72 domain-containing protein [Anaerobaca lacustris]|uniref:DUF72 domain-containing protein n=1 Tax=Anaerobaca lacustris TaxID=3044600 RepID=A0AAW6TWP0_9BACT|nr:DUF72 domain-containing protein [Sedimentisphaerales bacterium M17dextr]